MNVRDHMLSISIRSHFWLSHFISLAPFIVVCRSNRSIPVLRSVALRERKSNACDILGDEFDLKAFENINATEDDVNVNDIQLDAT